MKPTKENYFSPEINAEYMSVSQFKAFRACEAAALAEVKGEYKRPETKALQMGSYVDAYFSGEDMNEYRAAHPELFNSRTGALKAEFAQCNDIINAARADEMFIEYCVGSAEHQVIMTGELFGIPWKIKVDALHSDKIVDFKLMKDFDAQWKNGSRLTFIDFWDYALQGYIYREIVKQNTGEALPFYLAAMTKQEPSDRKLILIDEARLNVEEGVVEYWAERFQKIKEGVIKPNRCGRCAYCRATKRTTKATTYEELIEEMEMNE